MKPASATSSTPCFSSRPRRRGRSSRGRDSPMGDRRRSAMPALRATCRPRRLGDVAHDAGDLGGIVGGLGGPDQRGHVAAAARDQDTDLQLRHRLSACSTTQSASSVGARSMTPTSRTVSPAPTSALGDPRRHRRGDDDDHAEPAVERAQHVVGRHAGPRAAASRTPAAHSSAARRAARAVPSGRQRGTLPGRPPPVMCASPLIAPRAADRRQQRLHVDARRLEQGLASDRRRMARRVVAEAAALHDAAHQREAVGMQRRSRPGRARRRPARCRRAAAAASRSTAPTREAREIVVAVGIHAGHLRRLAADQRAAGAPAALGDAGDDRGGRPRRRACRSRSSRGRTAARRPAPRCR